MKKLFIRLLLILAALLLLLLIIGFVFFKNQAPDYNEELKIEGLNQEVNVYYDQYAIPHIYANEKEDAFMALGFVHAKDRLWQMEVLRRIAPGRLSELFGASTLDNDRFFRTIGLGVQSKIETTLYTERVPAEGRRDARRRGHGPLPGASDPRLHAHVVGRITDADPHGVPNHAWGRGSHPARMGPWGGGTTGRPRAAL